MCVNRSCSAACRRWRSSASAAARRWAARPAGRAPRTPPARRSAAAGCRGAPRCRSASESVELCRRAGLGEHLLVTAGSSHRRVTMNSEPLQARTAAAWRWSRRRLRSSLTSRERSRSVPRRDSRPRLPTARSSRCESPSSALDSCWSEEVAAPPAVPPTPRLWPKLPSDSRRPILPGSANAFSEAVCGERRHRLLERRVGRPGWDRRPHGCPPRCAVWTRRRRPAGRRCRPPPTRPSCRSTGTACSRGSCRPPCPGRCVSVDSIFALVAERDVPDPWPAFRSRSRYRSPRSPRCRPARAATSLLKLTPWSGCSRARGGPSRPAAASRGTAATTFWNAVHAGEVVSRSTCA